MIPPRIAAIVLAAGRSSRMPTNKLLAPLRALSGKVDSGFPSESATNQESSGKPVIRRTVEAVCASRADSVIVVTGHQANSIREVLADLPITIIDNVCFTDGLSSSLICGVKSLPPACDGFLVVLGDMPFVPPRVIDQLIETFDPTQGRAIVVPVRAGKRGNPVLWTISLAAEFGALAGDRGARHLMALHGDLLYELEVDSDSVLTDLDSPEDFAAR